jgi:hypothetical protein
LRGFNLEIWQSRDDFQAHLLHPDHIDMMALGSLKWGIRDLQMHFWMEADGYQFGVRDRTDTPVDGRGNLYDLIGEAQDRYRRSEQS